MNARLQTWFPFNVQICLNGREWLARQLARRRSRFERADNCFTLLGNPVLAQRLVDAQLQTDWPTALSAIVRDMNPLHDEVFAPAPMDYYWSVYQSEWATDLLFKSPDTLAALYPALVRFGIDGLKSPDVMRFLGQKLHVNYKGEVTSSYRSRVEGVRVKHRARGNSVKMYDKAARILRVETTMANTADFLDAETRRSGGPWCKPPRGARQRLHAPPREEEAGAVEVDRGERKEAEDDGWREVGGPNRS